MDLKLSYFCKKYNVWSAGGVVSQLPVSVKWGLLLQTPEIARPLPPLYISGCVPESNYIFAQLISMPQFERNNFYQKKLKIKLFLQKIQIFECQTPETAPPTPLQIYG